MSITRWVHRKFVSAKPMDAKKTDAVRVYGDLRKIREYNLMGAQKIDEYELDGFSENS